MQHPLPPALESIEALAGLCAEMDESVNALLLRDLAKFRMNISELMAQVEKVILEKSGDKSFMVHGFGEVEIKRRTKRTAWDRDALLSAVLDSRLVDPTSGEVHDETPIEKVLDVWNLGAPRVTALRERGLQPDEFCDEEADGWAVKLPT